MTPTTTINNSKFKIQNSKFPNPTLYSTVVKLIATQSGTLPATQGRLAQAALLDIIRAVDPELSAALHVKNQRRPYTVSPLQGLDRPHGKQINIKRGQEVWLRFTLLGSELFTTFTRYLLLPPTQQVGAGVKIRLGELDFALHEVLTTSGSHPWAGYTSLAELCRHWDPASISTGKSARKITMEFTSATVFSRSSNKNGMGKFMEPFPSPPMFFGSVAAKWRDHMPTPLPVDNRAIRDYAKETVVVGLYKMESRIHHYWGNPQIGAVGTVTYLLKDKHSPELIGTLNLLADFAFYSGVGAKTTMGMGQVRRGTGS